MTTGIRIADQSFLHVARRSAARSLAAVSKRDGVCETEAAPAAMPSQHAHEFPIWFTVLLASACLARANGEIRAINWDCVSGRAVYTNQGGDAERIEPLGVSLLGGHTLEVYWMPGDTEYTVEVYCQNERCA